MSIQQELLDMKRKIDESKSQHEQAQGALKQLYDDLEHEFDVKTLEAAEKLLSRMERESFMLATEIEESLNALKADYDWA